MPPIVERFEKDCPQGHVIGSPGPGGAMRRGRDAERQIGIDNGALRFRPLIIPGWGREGVVYGPFRRESGLTLAVAVTNGHNASQGGAIPDRFLRRVARWAIGPNADPPLERALEWLRGPRKWGTLRRLRWWAAIRPSAYRLPRLDENLAVGWFSDETPGEPGWRGCYFMMHSAEEENGELWARLGEQFLSAFRGVKNTRLYFVVALRQQGAVYYAATVAGAGGLGPFPKLRPIAVDPFNDDHSLYAGIHQCSLGQIGWRVDTLTHELMVKNIPEFAGGFGTAHVAETFTGPGQLCDIDGWSLQKGRIRLTHAGATGEDALASTLPDSCSGLIHARVSIGGPGAAAGLVWRLRDSDNFCLLRLSAAGCALVRIADGSEDVVAEDCGSRLVADTAHSVQILDSHGQIGCYLDGDRLFDDWFASTQLGDGRGLGIWFGGPHGATVRDLEAHPREIDMPRELDFRSPWDRLGTEVAFADDFSGATGDLSGRRPTLGDGEWGRSAGRGSFRVIEGGAVRVCGDVAEPHPGRTFYTLPWDQPDFADLEVEITPPGQRRGEGHRARSGLVFWQDRRNHLTLSAYLDDSYQGASVSVFPKRHGFEELYDAVWTMVGNSIEWGQPFRLRCAFDGSNFLILLNDEPIMQRALCDLYPTDRPLHIRRVGLATNWEWGRDTGSTFRSFKARS